MKRNISKNKGFTLIELLIVVAIIAVLAAVLVPQYLRYVETANRADDIATATTLMQAARTVIEDPLNGVPEGYIIEIAWTTDAEHSIDGAIIVRFPNRSWSKSELYPAPGVPGLPDNHAAHAVLDDEISRIMGADPGRPNTGTQVGEHNLATIHDARSDVGNGDDFIFHINTTTGEVAVTNEAGPWVDDLGLQAGAYVP